MCVCVDRKMDRQLLERARIGCGLRPDMRGRARDMYARLVDACAHDAGTTLCLHHHIDGDVCVGITSAGIGLTLDGDVLLVRGLLGDAMVTLRISIAYACELGVDVLLAGQMYDVRDDCPPAALMCQLATNMCETVPNSRDGIAWDTRYGRYTCVLADVPVDVSIVAGTYRPLDAIRDETEFVRVLNAVLGICETLSSMNIVHRRLDPSVFMQTETGTVRLVSFEGSYAPGCAFLHVCDDTQQMRWVDCSSMASDVVSHTGRGVVVSACDGAPAHMDTLKPSMQARRRIGVDGVPGGSMLYGGSDMFETSRVRMRCMLETVGFCMWEWALGGCSSGQSVLPWGASRADMTIDRVVQMRVSFAAFECPLRARDYVQRISDTCRDCAPDRVALIARLGVYFNAVYMLDIGRCMFNRTAMCPPVICV